MAKLLKRCIVPRRLEHPYRRIPARELQLVISPTAPVTQGARVSDNSCGPFRIVESFHQPRLTLTRHRHEWPTITIVLAGEFAENLPDGPRLCQARTVLLKPAGVLHSNLYGSRGARCLIAEVRSVPVAADGYARAPGIQRVLFNAHGGAARLAGRIAQAYRDADDAGRMTLESLLYQVIETEELRVHSGARCSAVQAAVEYLHAGFHHPMRLADVAAAAGVHPTYLARAFRRHFNRTPGDLLRELRVNWAAHLLDESERPLAMVALSAGFADQSHLTRVFGRRMGATPARYRQDRGRR